MRQRESRASQQGERESKECGELLDAPAELQDFLLKFRALTSVTSRLTPEPLPELESWLRTLLDLRRASANLDTLVALHGELAAVCRPGSP